MRLSFWLALLLGASVGCNEAPAPPAPNDDCRLGCEAAIETCYAEVCWERYGEREAKAANEAKRRDAVEDMVTCRRACAFHRDACLSACASSPR